MRGILISVPLFLLAACGGDGMTPQERAELEAKCAVINKIVSARGDTPAFSSLTVADVPPGAESRERASELYPAENWLDLSDVLKRPAYVSHMKHRQAWTRTLSCALISRRRGAV